MVDPWRRAGPALKRKTAAWKENKQSSRLTARHEASETRIQGNKKNRRNRIQEAIGNKREDRNRAANGRRANPRSTGEKQPKPNKRRRG